MIKVKLKHTTRTPKKFYLVARTIGKIGASVEDEIAYTFGLKRPLWNYRTVATDGSGLSLMASYRRCIRAAAPKVELIVQVG